MWRLLGWLVIGGSLVAASPALAALTQGYPADSTMLPGTIVALASDGSGKVAAANTVTSERIFGVVAAPSDSSLSLSSPQGQVQVITSGLARVLVTTANGAIKSGDAIAISSIAGVGMKATAASRVIGAAQADFSGTTAGAQTIALGSGKTAKQVSLGEITVQVGVTDYVPKLSSGAASAIENFATNLAGKPVSSPRLIAVAFILLAGVLSSTVLLYAAVRNSIVAIGRNPLARGAIFNGLARILAVIIAIIGVTGVAVYLVIR